MAICPYCALEFYLENEDDLEKGDVVNCDECGATLEVVRTNELELRLVSEDDDPEAEPEAEEEKAEEEEELDEEESYDEDFSDNGYYDIEEEAEEEEEE
jgi:alpha-aminoadipate/glutamate carrier protein LysW